MKWLDWKLLVLVAAIIAGVIYREPIIKFFDGMKAESRDYSEEEEEAEEPPGPEPRGRAAQAAAASEISAGVGARRGGGTNAVGAGGNARGVVDRANNRNDMP